MTRVNQKQAIFMHSDEFLVSVRWQGIPAAAVLAVFGNEIVCADNLGDLPAGR